MAQGKTLNIPTTTLAVGARTFGPFNINPNSSQAVITLDRTVAGGLNSLDATSVLTVTVQSSPDGGTTWNDEVSATFPGGVYSKNGVQVNSAVLTVQGLDGGRNSCRVQTVVSGPSSIVVAGTAVVS